MRPCEWGRQEQQDCRFSDSVKADPRPSQLTLPYLDSLLLFGSCCPPPLESLLPVSAVPCASEPRLSLVTEGMGDLSYHLTHNPSEEGWAWSHPLIPQQSGF